MEEGKNSRFFVLPVDKSLHSERAFDWYINNVHKPGDKVGIVHIHEPPHVAEAFSAWDRIVVESDAKWERDIQKSVADAKDILKKYEEKAKKRGIESESIIKSSNHGPGQTICEIAEKNNANGIIIGSRGLNLLRRTFLGSVSSYVVNHANTAVTITPPAEDIHVHALQDDLPSHLT